MKITDYKFIAMDDDGSFDTFIFTEKPSTEKRGVFEGKGRTELSSNEVLFGHLDDLQQGECLPITITIGE